MRIGSAFNGPGAAARPLLVALVAGVLVAGLPSVASAAPTPSVSIGDVSVSEGNAGTTSATFTIQASPAPKNCCPLQVGWATAPSTARPPGDYTTSSGTVSLTRSAPSRTVTVPVVGDALDEADETFVVNLSNPVGSPGRISDGQGVGTITDDDPAPSLSVGDVSVTEGNAGTATATFTISLSAASGRTVSVGWATEDDEATAPSDYAAASGTLTYAPGDTAEVASVSVNGDVTAELDERFAVVLSTPTNAAIDDDRAVGTILDDEMLPVIDIDDPSVAEGASGTRPLAFEVSLSNPAAFPVRVDWATGTTGTATPGTDHTAAGGTITFAPFDTSETVTVPVLGDAVHERDETVHVDLSNPVGAPIGDARGVGTISNDDPQPSFSVGDASVAEGDAGATVLSFPVTLTGDTALDAGVDVATADGTATGEDYSSVAAHLTFPAGTSSATVDVTVSGDVAFEPDERFTLSLSDATGATIADASATGTIVNDDPARTKITLKVAKLRRVVRASGVLEPTETGHRVTVTLFRKRGARFATVVSKTVRVKALRDRDGDGRPDGAYAASFRRPTGPGRFKVTARFRPRPGIWAPAGPACSPCGPAASPVGAARGSGRRCLTVEHLFDSVAPSPHRTEAPVPASAPVQTTLGEAIPLEEVTFVVVDLETTGGSPHTSRITEVGAVRITGGAREGTFHSLVNPQEPIPAYIAHLTGIDDLLVRREPPIEAVLPSFVEFARGAVFVAHNARFDFSFLNENLRRLDYPALEGPPVCTAKLAKRVVWPDVPNVRLATLANHFRTRTKPIHRALEDAMACAEVLDALLEAGGRLGIRTLGDLREAVLARGRPHYGKIALADALPRAAGVYRFVGRDGRVLYVGKARDLRSRVRSYFYGDERKRVDTLLAEVRSVEGETTPGGELEALVLEARLIRRHEPAYNRRGRTWRRFAYLKLDPAEAYPRLKVVHRVTPGAAAYLGPFSGTAAARLAKEALEEVVPVRRCTRSMGARTRFPPCALADIGRCPAPCDGRIDPERYGELVRDLLSSLRSPDGLLAALETRMVGLAARERFEEAAAVRDRLRAVAAALRRSRQEAWLVGAGRLELEAAGGTRLTFVGGALERAGQAPEPIELPCPRERADELSAVRSWLARNRVRVVACEVPPAEPVDGGARIDRILRWSPDGRAHRDG